MKTVLTPWQQAILDLVLEELAKGRKRHIIINAGRRAGHTTLAAALLQSTKGHSCAIVPNKDMPYAHKQHLVKLLDGNDESVWVSTPLEAEPNDGVVSTVTKYDIIDRTFEPLRGKELCVIDGASHYSQWELDPIRMAEWTVLVELG